MAKKHKQKAINWKKVEGYLKAGCSGREIAAQLGIHENTLYLRCKEEKNVDFVAFKQEKQAAGDAMLKAVQFESAVTDRDRTMQIWLGKQRLGQKDKIESTNKNLNADIKDVGLNIEDMNNEDRKAAFKLLGIQDEFNRDDTGEKE